MLLRVKPKKADGLITTPVLAQFGPGVESRLLTRSGQIFNMFLVQDSARIGLFHLWAVLLLD